MTIADSTRKSIISFINDKTNTDKVRKYSPRNARALEKLIKSLNHDDKMKWFLRWVAEQSRKNYYYTAYTNNEINKVNLYTRNFKGVLTLGYVTPLRELRHHFKDHKYIIEIIHIHSFQKGEGYKMMKSVIDLSEKLQAPISLWTETQSNVEYFERYGFKNFGFVGSNNEFLMVLKYKEP